jgi:hypothetical protein
MKNRSGTYGKTRKTLPLAASPEGPLSELECSPSRKLVRREGGRGGKGLNGIAKTLKKQSIFPSP